MPRLTQTAPERACSSRLKTTIRALVLASTCHLPTNAAVVGSATLDYTFTPSSTLYGYSDSFFLPGVSEIRFRTITSEVTNGQASFINGNMTPLWPAAHMSFTSWTAIANWSLPNFVGAGGWSPDSPLETNLAEWNLGLLAFSVERDDGQHYGWLEFSVHDTTFTLHRYGFEDTAGQAIQFGDTGQAVPVPSSLALAAVGLLALGVKPRRSRKSDGQGALAA